MSNHNNIISLINNINNKIDKLNSEPGREWLRTKEAAIYLGISETQIHNFKREGLIPYSKLGGSLYFKKSDIDRLLEENIQGGQI